MMQIKVLCTCSNSLLVDQDLAGAQIRCPECKEIIIVPELALTTPEDPQPSDKDLSFAMGFGIALLALSTMGLAAWIYLREPEPAMGGAQVTQSLKNNPNSSITILRSETYDPPKIDPPNNITPNAQVLGNSIDRNDTIKPPDPLAHQKGLTVLRLTSIAWSSAYDSNSGRVALTDDQNGIIIYSIDDLINNKFEPIASIAVKGKATSICLKPFGNSLWFACVSSDSPEITLIDTTTLQVVRQIPVTPGTRLGFIASSKTPDDPYLYYIRERENSNSLDARFGRMDLRNQMCEELIGCQFLDCQISPDGKSIYTKTHTTGTNKCEYAYGSWDDFRRKHYDSRRTVQITTQTGTSIRLLGKKVALESTYLEPSYGGRMELALREVSQAEFEPLARSDSKPLALGLSDSGFVVGSTTTGKPYVDFRVPRSLERSKQEIDNSIKSDLRNRKRYGTQIGHAHVDGYVDDQRQVALAAIDDYLMLFAFNALDLPESDPLDLSIDFPTIASIDEPLKVNIPQSASENDVEFTFKFLSNVKGGANQSAIELPTFSDNKICWTPGRNLIGKQDILITATLGDDRRSWIWPIDIGYQGTEELFDFYVQGISGSPQSKLAVVWGIAHRDVPIRYPQDGQAAKKVDASFLATYDTVNRKTLNRIQLPYDIDDATLHPTGIYAISSNSQTSTVSVNQSPGRLLRFEIESLKRIGSMPLNLSNPLGELSSFQIQAQGTNELAVLSKPILLDPHRVASVCSDYRIAIPELNLLATSYPRKFRMRSLDASSPIQDGILWDKSLGVPKLLIDPSEILDTFGNNNNDTSLWENIYWPSKRKLPGTYVSTAKLQARATSRGIYLYSPEQNPTIKKFEPVAVISFPKPDGSDNSVKGTTDEFDQVIKSHEIEAQCGAYLYATSAGRLFRIPVRSLPEAPDVFALEEKQDHFVFRAGEKVKWNYSAPGATKYSLQVYLHMRRSTWQGLEYDDSPSKKLIDLQSNDGQFEFEIEKEMVIDAVSNYLKVYFMNPSFSLIELIGLIDIMERPYRRLTGKMPTTVPAVVTLVINAQDRDGQQKAKLSHCALVEVPIEELLPKIEALRANLQSERNSAR